MIDVGYAGVIGADRILDGQAPYGHMPVEDALRACGKADADGEIRDRIQHERPLRVGQPARRHLRPRRLPGLCPGASLHSAWSGKWDSLPAAHATAIVFDLARRARPLPRRPAVRRDAAGRRPRIRLGRVSVHGLRDECEHERCDHARDPRLGIPGSTSASARGAAVALAGWTKFAALLLAPLWLTYPNGFAPPHGGAVRGGVHRSRRSPCSRCSCSSRASSRRPAPSSTARSGYQLDRGSPFSPWDWGQYHARGIPDLAVVQLVLQIGVLALAGVVAAVPLRKGPLELAALSAAVLLGFELASPTGRTSTSRGSCRSSCSPSCSRGKSRPTAVSVGAEPRGPCSSPWPLQSPRSRGFVRRRPRRAGRDLRHARLPALRRADRGRRPALPRLRGRIPARGPGAVRRSRRSSSSTPDGYDTAFQALMVLALGASSVLHRALARRAAAPRTAPSSGSVGAFLAGIALLGPFVLTRFDLYAAALTLAAICAILHGRDRLGADAARRRDRDEDLSRGAAAAARGPDLEARRAGRRAARAGLDRRHGARDLPPVRDPRAGGRGPQRLAQVGRPLQIESLGLGRPAGAPPRGSGCRSRWASGSGSQNLTGTVATVASSRDDDRRRGGAVCSCGCGSAAATRRATERFARYARRGDRRVRRVRQGRLAAVPRLAARRSWSSSRVAGGGRDDARCSSRCAAHPRLVPEQLLGSREAVRPDRVVARARSATSCSSAFSPSSSCGSARRPLGPGRLEAA